MSEWTDYPPVFGKASELASYEATGFDRGAADNLRTASNVGPDADRTELGK